MVSGAMDGNSDAANPTTTTTTTLQNETKINQQIIYGRNKNKI